VSSEDEIIESLILNGGLEISGIDIESGEMLYNFTDELKNINPELHKVAQHYFHLEMMNLWEKGFLDINLESDDPIVSITDKSTNQESLKMLNKDEQKTLEEVFRVSNKEK
jgi:hypothetical protein